MHCDMLPRIIFRGGGLWNTYRRQNLPTLILTVIVLTVMANLFLKSNFTPSIDSKSSVDTELSPGVVEARQLSLEQLSLRAVQSEERRKKQIRDVEKSVWKYHAPDDEFFERANLLASSNILITKEQNNGEPGIFPENEGPAVNSNRERISQQKTQQQQEKNSISFKNTNDYHDNDPSTNTNLNYNGEDGVEDPNSLLPLSQGRLWRTWPECLCGAAADIECSARLEPAEARNMNHDSGGSCSWRAWQQSSDKVISVGLYGPPLRVNFKAQLQTLIDGSVQHFPGWSVWVYLRHPKPADLCPLLQSAPHVFFCDARSLPALGDLKRTMPLMWKISPLGDPKVRAMYFRNLNNSPMERESAALQEWLFSNKTWHLMRDHPQHTLPVGSGLWAARWDSGTRFKMAALRNIVLARTVTTTHVSNAIQFLSNVLWPQIERSGSVMQHYAYHCSETLPHSNRPWPTRRVGNSYVGMGAEEMVMPDCPLSCRPSLHQDWTTC